MTPALLTTDPKALDARKPGRRDALSGRSGQGDDAQAFEGMLAQVDTGQTSGTATTGLVVQGQMTKAATAATIVAAAGDDPSLLSLVERSITTTAPSGSHADKDDESSKDGSTSATGGVADPGMSPSAALTAALAALQSALPAPGGASTTSAGTRSKVTSDAGSSLPATTTISNVKVESHLQIRAQPAVGHDTTASPQTIQDAAPTSKATSEKALDGTGPLTASLETKDDPAIVLVPAASTPLQAIANAVSTLAKAAEAATVVPSDTTATTVSAPPRTMTLQLTPANLGTVSVTMHLVGQSLDLQLGVSDKETLGAITRSRDSLTEAMQDQGYDLRSLVIQGANASASSSTNDGGAAGGQHGGSPSQSDTSGQGPASGQPGGYGSSGTDRRDAQPRRTWPDDTSRAPADSGTGALFV